MMSNGYFANVKWSDNVKQDSWSVLFVRSCVTLKGHLRKQAYVYGLSHVTAIAFKLLLVSLRPSEKKTSRIRTLVEWPKIEEGIEKGIAVKMDTG